MDRVGFLFPGQGAHCESMLDGLADHPNFETRYRIVSERLGQEPLSRRNEPDFINSNKVSSLLTVLASSISLDIARAAGIDPYCAAGYSVGQWTALYAAGVVCFEDLVEIVWTRASFMDQCFENKRGAMLAVIGLPLKTVEEICSQFVASGDFLAVSNVNCVGQYSLAGSESAVHAATAVLEGYMPKKLARLPVAGAWHCQLLAEASREFESYLSGISLKPWTIPVCDNVTGEFLPADERRLKTSLARQVSSPVLWEKCINTMAAHGCTELMELGFGNVLTKFGFFINRKVTHSSFYTSKNES